MAPSTVIQSHGLAVSWNPDTVRSSVRIGVVGHRQVTDRYLYALAQHHNLTLATFDKGLASLPGTHLICA